MEIIMEKSYKQLVQEAAAHSSAAAEELYTRTYRSAGAAVRMLVKNPADGEDILQEAYLSAFTHLDTLQDPEKFPAWVNSIAMNRCKDFLKKKKPQLFSDMETNDGDAIDFEDDRTDFQPDAQMDLRGTTEIFDKIIAALPEDQRMCIILYYWNELSVSEIATSLQVPEATVKSRLNYGRKKIEVAVKDEEKRSGIKLYSAAPVLILLLKGKMELVEIPTFSTSLLAGQSFAAGAATGNATAGATAAKTAESGANSAIGSMAKAVAGVAAKSGIATKVIAGVVAAAVLAGGALGISTAVQNSRQQDDSQPVQEKSTEPAPQEKDVWDMDCQMSKRNGDRVEIVYDGVTYWHEAKEHYKRGGSIQTVSLYMQRSDGTKIELTDSLYGPTFYLVDGKLLYCTVTGEMSSEIAYIDLNTLEKFHTNLNNCEIFLVTDAYIVTSLGLVKTADLNSRPNVKYLDGSKIALSGNNTYFYATPSTEGSQGCTISKYNSEGELLSETAVPEKFSSIAVNRDTLYICNGVAYKVYQYDLTTGIQNGIIDIDIRNDVLTKRNQDAASFGNGNTLNGEVYMMELLHADTENLFLGCAVTDVNGNGVVAYNGMTYCFNIGEKSATLVNTWYMAAGGIKAWEP